MEEARRVAVVTGGDRGTGPMAPTIVSTRAISRRGQDSYGHDRLTHGTGRSPRCRDPRHRPGPAADVPTATPCDPGSA